MVEEIEKLTGQLLQEIKDFQSSCDDNMIRIGVDVVEQALGMKIDQLQNDYEIPILNSNDAYQLEAVTRLSREILKNPRDRLKLDDTKSISLEPIVMKKQRRQSTKVRTKFSKPPSIDTAALSQMAGKSYLRKLYRNVVTGIETQTLANQVTTLETKQIQLEGISKENEKTVADLRASLAASEKRNQELEMTIIKLKASQSGDEDLQRKHQELQNKLSRKRTKLADVMLEALWKDNDNLLVMKENDKLKTAIRTINEDNNRYRTSHEKLKDLYLEDSTTWDEKQNALLTEISRLNSSTRELQKLLNEKSKELADIELAKAYNFISIGTNTSFKEYSEGLDTTKKYASIDDSPQQTSRSASPNNSLGKNQLSPIGRYINKGKSPKRTYNSSPLGQSSTTTLENRHAGGRCHYHTHKDLGSTSLRRGTYFGTYQPDSPEFSEAQSCQSLAELQLHWKKSLRKHSDSSGSPPRTERKRIPEDYKKYVPSIQRSTSRQEVKARLNEAIRNQVTRRRKNKYSTKNVTTN